MKNSMYFSHDSNAKDDPKCVLLIDQLGLEGYGIFWVLLEILREQKDYRYPIKLIPSIAKRFSTSTEKIKAVIKSYDLFSIDSENFFFSESFLRRMHLIECKSDKARKSALVKWERQRIENKQQNRCERIANAMQSQSELTANAMQSQSELTANAMQLKETKLKETKIENKENIKEKKSDEYEEKYNTRLGKIDPEVKKLFLSYCDQRKKQKKPVTSHAGYILLGNLWQLSQDPAIQKKIIEQSIARSYQDFFPVTEPKQEQKRELNSSERLPYLN